MQKNKQAPPTFLQYPVHKRAHRITQAAVRMTYGGSYWTSLVSLIQMMKLQFVDIKHDHDHTPL
jgi:hypothetical protein